MSRSFTAFACAAALSLPQAAWAQEDASNQLLIELNAATSTETGCTLSFFVQNGHQSPLDSLIFEAVLFDEAGQVERLTLLDMGALPVARPRVRQFVIGGKSCDSFSRVLLNGAQTCEGENLPEGACSTALRLSSRGDVELVG